MNFYDNFVSLCVERQMTPSAVAQKAGLDKSIVSYWKKHDNVTPKFENLQKIAEVLEVPLFKLISPKGHLGEGYEEYLEYATRTKNVNVVGELSRAIVQFADNEQAKVEKELSKVHSYTDVICSLMSLGIDENNSRTLITSIVKLNKKGQQIAVDRVEELTKIPDYQKADEED